MKKTGILLITLFIFFAITNIIYGDITPTERAALIALYTSTNGAGWNDDTNWLGPVGSENTWYGVTCDAGNTTVLSIDLSSNVLIGPLPIELGNLTNLTVLRLNDNQLNGSIPEQLGNLTNLTTLSLRDNQLIGNIPGQLENLSSISLLNLSINQLTGNIPTELGNLSTIVYLYLNSNQLTGNIPPELGNLSELLRMYLDHNYLSGTIPLELENLSNIQYLRLGANLLTGSIPSQLGNILSMTYLNLHQNYISGTIPPELGNLSNLTLLLMPGNQITGDIPSSITNLTNLTDNINDFRWNGIYTSDSSVETFLNSKQDGGDWESTQTIPPENVAAGSVGFNSIEITWSAITYTGETGGYRVHYSENSGGPYTLFGITADKTIEQMNITGLNEGTTYYFVVQTRTNSHLNNINILDSEYSEEVSETTLSVSVSGSVTNSGSQGIENVILTFSNGGGSASTDSSGNYTHTVANGWSGTVTPSIAGYNTFTPPSRTYSNVTVDQTSQNYTAAPITYIVSGRITDSGGSGLSNAQLSFSNGGWTTTTNSNGDYSQVVTYNWSGTVTPTKAGYYFTPTYRTYSNVLSNQTSQNYTTAGIANTISGRITDGSGSGLSNVELTFSNSGGTVVTNSNGEYSHSVADNWSGDVIPSKKSYLFSPSSKSYTKVKSNFSNQDYRAEAITPSISGMITDIEGNVIENVVISFSNINKTVITDYNGKYSQAVPFNWTGTITPIKQGFSFSPDSYSYSNTVLNQTNQDFIILQDITLSINAMRKTDSAWIVQIQYGELELIIKKKHDDIQVSKYVIYRKISGFDYEIIKELSDSSIQDDKIVYLDKNLEENLNYTYKVVALNSNGDIIGSSNESTI